MAKVLDIDLSLSGIQRAIDALDQLKSGFNVKVETFLDKVAEAITNRASEIFQVSIVDETTNVPTRTADVSVTWQAEGPGTRVVVASGEDAVWVEFGAGICFNTSPGQSLNPLAADLGFTIGSMGRHGKYRTWYYKSEDGTLVRTHGTKARMPMYTAMKEVCDDIASIAQEVFG